MMSGCLNGKLNAVGTYSSSLINLKTKGVCSMKNTKEKTYLNFIVMVKIKYNLDVIYQVASRL